MIDLSFLVALYWQLAHYLPISSVGLLALIKANVKSYNVMRVKSLHLFTRLIATSFNKIHHTLVHNLREQLRHKNHVRKVLVGLGLALSLNQIYAIEDEAIRSLKYTMGKEINALRS